MLYMQLLKSQVCQQGQNKFFNKPINRSTISIPFILKYQRKEVVS